MILKDKSEITLLVGNHLYTSFNLIKVTSREQCKANVLAAAASSSCWLKSIPNRIIVVGDIIVVATDPTASVGVNKLLQDLIRDISA
jgi:hypothetical protein